MTAVWTKPLLAVTLAFLVVGCDKPKAAATAPPPPKVTVAHPIVRDVTQWDEYTGRLEAVEKVDVKAQVSGFVATVPFTEGSLVNKGDVILTIDSRIFEAQLDNAKSAELEARARLKLAEATLQLAMNDLKRGEAVPLGTISSEDLDQRRTTVSQSQASVGEAQAAIAVAESNVKSAELNVEWCKVTAPISGRISNKGITAGNMLTGGPGQTTTITTITSVDPIYCYVDADENAVLKYQKLARETKRVSAEQAQIACYMQLSNETGFPRTGVVDFVDNRINPTTGTRRVRGIFPNPDGSLLPGFFTRFRVVGQQLHDAMLIVDDCIGTDQDRKYVYVLHAGKTAERRTVTVGPREGELRVITSNLAKDDLVLINGLSSVRPDIVVDPATVPMPEHKLAEAAVAATTQAASMPATTPTTGAAK